MFALSVKQPWAECLVNGSKSIEIRTWQPSPDLREKVMRANRLRLGLSDYPLLAIHAGKSIALDAPVRIWELARMRPAHPSMVSRLGGIVGVARLVAWHWYRTDGQVANPLDGRRASLPHGRDLFEREQPLHLNPLEWWAEGLCAWVFAGAVRLETVLPLRGQLGVWDLPAEVEAMVHREIDGIREAKASG